MNTTKRYLKEIRYRKARCCATCRYCVTGIEGTNVNYCQWHDNPTGLDMMCKYYVRLETEEEEKKDG